MSILLSTGRSCSMDRMRLNVLPNATNMIIVAKDRGTESKWAIVAHLYQFVIVLKLDDGD